MSFFHIKREISISYLGCIIFGVGRRLTPNFFEKKLKQINNHIII